MYLISQDFFMRRKSIFLPKRMDMDVTRMMTQEAEQPGNNNTAPDDVILRIQPPANGILKRHRHRRASCSNDDIDRDVSYKGCLKNHAASIGGHALDGCLEFMPSPASNPADPKSLTCDACGCHRNFHRRCRPHDTHLPVIPPPPRPPSPNPPCRIDFQPLNRHQPPPPPVAVVPLAAAPPPRSPGSSSPSPISSTYYSLAMRLPTAPNNTSGRRSGQQKRFRTKFSPVQKEKMLEFAEKVSWRMQRSELGAVRDFCNGIGVNRNVFKVWMHNNKNTLGKRSSGCDGAITTNGTICDFPKNGDNDYGRDHDNAVACGNNPGGVRLGTNGSPSSS